MVLQKYKMDVILNLVFIIGTWTFFQIINGDGLILWTTKIFKPSYLQYHGPIIFRSQS